MESKILHSLFLFSLLNLHFHFSVFFNFPFFFRFPFCTLIIFLYRLHFLLFLFFIFSSLFSFHYLSILTYLFFIFFTLFPVSSLWPLRALLHFLPVLSSFSLSILSLLCFLLPMCCLYFCKRLSVFYIQLSCLYIKRNNKIMMMKIKTLENHFYILAERSRRVQVKLSGAACR